MLSNFLPLIWSGPLLEVLPLPSVTEHSNVPAKLEALLPERTYVVETANLSMTGLASIKVVPVIIGILFLVHRIDVTNPPRIVHINCSDWRE